MGLSVDLVLLPRGAVWGHWTLLRPCGRHSGFSAFSLFPGVPPGPTEPVLIREGGLLDAEGPGGGREPSFQGPAFCPLALPELPQFLPRQACGSAGRGWFPFSFKAASLRNGRGGQARGPGPVSQAWRDAGAAPRCVTTSAPSRVTCAGPRGGGGADAGGHGVCPAEAAVCPPLPWGPALAAERAPAGTAFPSLSFSVCGALGRSYSGGLHARSPRWASCRRDGRGVQLSARRLMPGGALGEAPPRPAFLL